MRNVVKLAVAVAVLVGFLAPLAPSQAQAPGQVVAEERSGTILKIAGTSVIVRNDKNEIKKYNGIPAGMTIMVDGKPIKFRDLREGMKYNAVRFENVQPAVTITEAELAATPSAPPVEEAAPAAAPAPAPAPAPAAEPTPAKLPATGSSLPLAALLGLGLVGAGLALGAGRR